MSPQSLGLSCPKGGQVYVCEGNQTEFLGCCKSDPCADGSGNCPKEDLRTTTFSTDAYDEIRRQGCAGSKGGVNWWTCTGTAPPFMGCCSVNPCQSTEGDACPDDDLYAAQLSTDDDGRRAFLTGTDTHSSTPSLSTGAIVGIAIGAVVLLLAAVAGCLYIFKRGRHAERKSNQKSYRPPPITSLSTNTTAVPSQEFSPYRDTYNGDPYTTPPLHHPSSPSFMGQGYPQHYPYHAGAKPPYRNSDGSWSTQHPSPGYDVVPSRHPHHVSQISEADSEPVRSVPDSSNPATVSELSGGEVGPTTAASPSPNPGHTQAYPGRDIGAGRRGDVRVPRTDTDSLDHYYQTQHLVQNTAQGDHLGVVVGAGEGGPVGGRGDQDRLYY